MNDRFEAKQIHKKAVQDKKASKQEDANAVGSKKNDMKSSKFFSRMQDVAKDDAARKDLKRQAKKDGKNASFAPSSHTNESTKRFKL